MKWMLLLAALALLGSFPAHSSAEEILFTYVPAEGEEVQSISVRGSFNNWGESAMSAGDDGIWSVTVPLDPGEHTYKYFLNGQWPKDMEIDKAGEPMDTNAEDYVDDTYGGQNAVRIVGGEVSAPAVKKDLDEAPPLEEGKVRIHYFRPKGDYDSWGLHVWEDADEQVTWPNPLAPAGEDPFGLWWDVRIKVDAAKIGFIIHSGDNKDPGDDMFLQVGDHGKEIWIVSGSSEIHLSVPDVAALSLGDIRSRSAYWLTKELIVWKVRKKDGNRYYLNHADSGGLVLAGEGVQGGASIELSIADGGIPADVKKRFPHVRGTAFSIPEGEHGRIGSLLQGQIALSMSDGSGKLIDATGIQIPGVLDDLYAWDGPLGITWSDGIPTVSLWAPTAKSVRLLLFDGAASVDPAVTADMTRNSGGAWSVEGAADWKGRQYLYEVEVFVPDLGEVAINRVTDPYSRGLSTNSARSLLVDLDDPALAPEGWDSLEKPALESAEDIILYELHLRDFSAFDSSVPEEMRGTFQAFTVESNGSRHLRTLAEAGLTHVHLLPLFDIATIEEERSLQSDPGDLSGYPSDSEEPQRLLGAVKDRDGYNWGYDPYHFGVPEGSYSTDPGGVARIVEFRRMIAALSGMGLRVVMDVVYNHTHASGQGDQSVLDRIVPGYYHRLNSKGGVETSTCCQNTATEHAMMERLMTDDLVHWARDYKVDGFRFDLMGHHMKRNMEEARNRLHALTKESDGVDGSKIYLYGEGWDFGEVGGGARGVNATQPNMAGTGIGTFNDRMRDAVRGGSPFSDRRDRGFATGGAESGGDNQKDAADRIRIGLAGNLSQYKFTAKNGQETTGGAYSAVGYASQPRETINYISAHDNETFYDKIAWAAPRDLPVDERVRMQCMAISLTALGQGIPFFHAGVEMLRSKSMDADSYNSGDWFNRLDYSYSTNNFGVGLPSAEKNKDRWSLMKPILADKNLQPNSAQITRTVEHFREMLRIRKSSPLFRLASAEAVQNRVKFHNTGPGQKSGLIVMSLADDLDGVEPIDPVYSRIVVLFNSSAAEHCFEGSSFEKGAFELHAVQQQSGDTRLADASFDAGRGRFCVPARTTAVFVVKR